MKNNSDVIALKAGGFMEMELQSKKLFSLTESDQKVFGPKAFNLSTLHSFGLQVPDGICFAFPFRHTRDFKSDIDTAIQILFKSYEQNVFPVAVRSSSSLEDGQRHSFAGQFATVLNVKNQEELYNAILECLNSSQAEHVKDYKEALGISDSHTHFGIIIQKMISSQHSGVCFTESLSGEPLVIIDYVQGLGDQLLQGKAHPSQIILTKHAEIVQEERLEPDSKADQKLKPLFAKALAREAVQLEKRFGTSLDIEWAIQDDNLYFLQVRPATHRHTAQNKSYFRQQEVDRLKETSKEAIQVWSDASIGDVLPSPSGLTIDSFFVASLNGSGMSRAWKTLGFSYSKDPLGPKLFESICGQTFVNITEYIKTLQVPLPLKAILGKNNQVSFAFNVRPLTLLKSLLFPFWLVKVAYYFTRIRSRFADQFETQIFSEICKDAEIERSIDLTHFTDQDLWVRYVRLGDRSRNDLAFYHLLTDLIAGLTQSLARVGLSFIYKEKASQAEMQLFTGLEGNFNTETNLALYAVSQKIISMEKFLKEFGHRGHPDWDIASARWRENQKTIQQMLLQFERLSESPQHQFEKQVSQREHAVRDLNSQLSKRLWLLPFKKFLLNEIRYFQIYSPLREKTQSLCFMWVELLRKIVTEIKARAQVGNEIFELTNLELKQFFLEPASRDALGKKALSRLNKRQALKKMYVPHFLSSETLNTIDRPLTGIAGVKTLRGNPVCFGAVEGIARVVHGLEEATQLQTNEILVVQFTDPSWTPLFLIARGLILEQGSSFSHGAIVAREFGLPALVNVSDATRLIKTGDRILLDAHRGEVQILSE